MHISKSLACVTKCNAGFFIFLYLFYFSLRTTNQKNRKMKKGLLFTIFYLFTISVSAQHSIELRSGSIQPPYEPTDPRSIECEVTASIDGQVITVSFSELTASQIVVRDSANLIVFNQAYSSAYSAQADLTSLVSGYYTLYIYAMGDWWYGVFELE